MSSLDPPAPDSAVPPTTSSPRRLWRNANLLSVLAGETVSDLGSQLGGLALPLAAALALQATPGQMAALSAAEYLPRIAVGLVAGVWIDRLRRRPVLLVTNAVRACVQLGMVAGLRCATRSIVSAETCSRACQRRKRWSNSGRQGARRLEQMPSVAAQHTRSSATSAGP